jgi:hypothetical protein
MTKKKQKDASKIENYKETLDLCKQHLEEVEALEKKRVTDGQTQIRADLFKGANSNTNFMVNIPKGRFLHNKMEIMKLIHIQQNYQILMLRRIYKK